MTMKGTIAELERAALKAKTEITEVESRLGALPSPIRKATEEHISRLQEFVADYEKAIGRKRDREADDKRRRISGIKAQLKHLINTIGEAAGGASAEQGSRVIRLMLELRSEGVVKNSAEHIRNVAERLLAVPRRYQDRNIAWEVFLAWAQISEEKNAA